MPKIHKPWVSHEELDAFLGGGILDVFPHAAEHEVGGGDLLAFASLTGFGTYIDQAVLQASNVQHASMLLNNTGLRVKDTNASHYLTIKPGSDITANRILTLTTGDAARTITLSGNPTLADWFDQAVKQASHVQHASVTVGNTGLHILDTNASHDLIIKPGSDLTADRILTLTTGNVARTVTLSGNPTLANWFDQAVKQASNPTFANLNLGASPSIRQLSGKLTIQTNEGVNTDTIVEIKGKGNRLGYYRSYDEDDAEYLQFHCSGGYGWIKVDGASPIRLDLQRDVAVNITCWAGIAAGNPYFQIFGRGTAANEWLQMRVEADNDALIEAEHNLNLRAGGGEINLGDENLTTTGIIAATTLQGALHWDYITNEPSYYPPEYHYHVGKDIVSLHLVDLDDVEAADIFDVLPTAAIHGEGNYDWWGTWTTTAAANTSAEITVLAGDDKMLTLIDNNGGDTVKTMLAVDAPHYMVTGVVQFQIREDAWGTVGIALTKGGARNMEFLMIDGGVGARKFWFFNGTAEVDLATAYIRNQWYTVRIHYDCVARAAVIFIDNTFVKRTTLSAAAICDYVDAITIETDALDTGYVVDINNLKIFNLTI